MAGSKRRQFIKQSAFLAFFGISPKIGLKSNPSGWESEIISAGNLEGEKDRYQALKNLASRMTLPAKVQQELNALLPHINKWANCRELIDHWNDNEEKRYLPWALRDVSIENNLPPRPDEDSLIYPLWCFYRSRMLIWRSIEMGEILGNPPLLAAHHSQSQKQLKTAQNAFDKNPIIPLYLGSRIKWPVEHDPGEDVPGWARHQRIAMRGLGDIIHWWIDHRQLNDGQYGGGWGDDVEMWRWWTPWLIGRKDHKINEAQRKMSDGLFQLKKMSGGYTSKMFDVEHTAEDSADTITAMMHIDPENEIWQHRARHLVQLMKDLWTGVNDRGFLQFKSTYFTHDKVDPSPRKACDTVYHPRAVQPALLLWQRTRDPELTDIFSTWFRTWVDAAARSERGKPAGIIPSAIHWPDGKVGGTGQNWWNPENHTSDPLYTWPSSMPMMTNSLLLAYHITREQHFLEPIFSMAEIRLKHLEKNKNKTAAKFEPGTESWCADQMNRFLTGTIAKYRLISGDTQFDELLKNEEDPYVQYSFFNKDNHFLSDLKNTADTLSHNYPMYTTEVRWTDRVLSFNKNYLAYIYPDIHTPNHKLLYSMLTGDPGSPLYFPLNGFQWINQDLDLAVRVKSHTRESADIDVFGFFDGKKTINLKTYLLQKGTYNVTQISKGKQLNRKSVHLTQLTNEIDFQISGNIPIEIRITKEK